MDENPVPTVHLDGSAVRRIREEKKLTQLYVAKVVGVTTDTISRWENNRYPSMKRSNAIRLAEALEVELEDILRIEVEMERDRFESLFSPRRWVGLILAILVLIGVAAWHYTVRLDDTVANVRARRFLPNYATPGTIIPVRVHLEIEKEEAGFILRERFPKGWKLIEASPPPSSLDNVDGIARWIVKPDADQDIIAYRLKVDDGESEGSKRKFVGEVVADPHGSGQSQSVAGHHVVGVDYYHWADSNGDGMISDWEVLRASDTADEMQQTHLDWNLIEDIWDAGSYSWDPETQLFVPEWPDHNGSAVE
ncbi:MAG: helix-turn-helix transcriptional regulator [Desulfuromonadales bacterium]